LETGSMPKHVFTFQRLSRLRSRVTFANRALSSQV